MAKFWEDEPILSWVVDDFEQFDKILQQKGFNWKSYLEDYKKDSFSKTVEKLIFQSPFSLNLGGETKKNKLIATDKPIGVFNFSLASKTLYPLSEFYSDRLEKEDPNRFVNLNLLSGIVPNLFIEYINVGNEKKYYYKDEKGVEYPCVKRIKGQTAIDRGVPNAKLEYKSKTKKVFQTYKRKGGKVRYVEIYTLFYYTRVSGDLQYAIRHLPALMCAEYLESVGIKTRIYMTRFVQLSGSVNLRERDLGNNAPLPMYEADIVAQKNNSFYNQVLIQPIIAKEFQQEIDNALACLISSEGYYEIYERIAKNTILQETTSGDKDVYGSPSWNQVQYWEGFERYRNKYMKYVKDGIFKSKEVLPESMIFFHDQSINNLINGFTNKAMNYTQRINTNPNARRKSEIDALMLPEVNIFFNWWMKTSANIIKHKINLINSNEYTKDLREIKSDIENSIIDVDDIIAKTQEDTLQDDFKETRDSIFYYLEIKFKTLPSGVIIVDFDNYINSLVKELVVFADGDFFPTPEDEVEKRLDFQQKIFEELKKI
jgi:hypothetical protein